MRLRWLGLTSLLAMLSLAGCAVDGSPGYVTPRGGISKDRVKAADIQVSLAQGYMERGRQKIALEHLQKALRMNPRSANAHTVSGVLYERINDTSNAEKHYRMAVTLEANSGDMNNNLGGFLCRTGKIDESLQYFDKAVADPFYRTPQAALTNAGMCANSIGRIDLAEAYLRRALERDPDFSPALLPMAVILHNAGDHMKARAFAQRYEFAEGDSAEFLSLAIDIENSLGDDRAANEYASRLFAAYPDSEQARQLKEKLK